VVFGEEFFEFSADLGSVCGALAVGSDCDPERAAVYYGRDVEVAEGGHVYYVAEYVAGFAVGVDLFVQFVVACCGDGEGCVFEVAGFVRFLQDGDWEVFAELFEFGVNFFCDDEDVGFCLAERDDFAGSDGACAYYDNAFFVQIEVYRVFCHGDIF